MQSVMDELVGKTLPLKFGSSFATSGKNSKPPDNSGKFHTVRYDFKPASLPRDVVGDVTVNAGRDVSITLPNPNEYEDDAVYKGNKKPAGQKECLLIIDHKTGKVTLEKLDSVMFVKKTRDVQKKSNPIASKPDVIPSDESPSHSGESNLGSMKLDSNSLKRPANIPESGNSSKSKKKSKSGSQELESKPSSTETKHTPSFADSVFGASAVPVKKSSKHSKNQPSVSSESSIQSSQSLDIPPRVSQKPAIVKTELNRHPIPPAARPAQNLSDSDSDSSSDDDDDSSSDDSSDDSDDQTVTNQQSSSNPGLSVLQQDLQLSDSD